MILAVVSTGHFDPLIYECENLRGKYEFFGQIGMGSVVPSFPHVRICSPEELEFKMGQAELVISHAGTGMLSMLYRLKKPTIVVPKQVRYGEANDGQVELAKKWAELGMGLLCMDVKELDATIQVAYRTSFKFPKLPALGKALLSELVISAGRAASSVAV